MAYHTMSKALAARLKETLLNLLSYQQTGCVKNLKTNILEISNILNLRGHIVER